MMSWTKEDDDAFAKAEEIHKIIENLSTADKTDDCEAMRDAENFLKKCETTKDKFNRTSINKNGDVSSTPSGPIPANGNETMEQSAFMAVLEADAKQRSERRLANRKRANEWKDRGNEYFRAADYPEAKRCYSEAMHHCKDWDVIYTNLAMTCNKLGQYEETLKHCDWAERLNETNVKALLHKGKALVALGRPNEALEAYHNVISIEPQKKTFMREYISEAEAAVAAISDEKEAAAAFDDKVSNSDRDEDPERLVLRLICEVARPKQDPMYYAGGLRCLTRAISQSLKPLQTLFRLKSGFTLFERADSPIGSVLTKSLSEQTHNRDVLQSIFELSVVVCEDNEENQRRMMAVNGLPARLLEVIKASTKPTRDPTLMAAVRFIFTISQSDSGRKAVNDWLDPTSIVPKLVRCVQQGSADGVGQHAAALLNNMALSPRFQNDMMKGGNMQITEAVESLLQDGGGQSSVCIASCLNCVMNLCGNTTIRRRLSCRLSFLKACTSAIERYLPLHMDERHTKIIQSLLGLLINVTTGVDKTSGALRSVAPRIVNAASKVLAVDHSPIHRDRLFTLLSTGLPLCDEDFIVAWCKNEEQGIPILGMARRIVCHEAGEHPAASVAVRVMAAATLHHTDTRYKIGDDEELVLWLAKIVQTSKNDILAGNAALCLSHCIEDTCLAEVLTNTDIIMGLLRRCSNSAQSEAQTNYGLLVAKLAQANPRHRDRLTELKGFEIIHAATRSLRT